MNGRSSLCDQVLVRGAVAVGDEELLRHLDGCESCREMVAMLTIVNREADPEGALLPLDDLAARKTVDEVLRRHHIQDEQGDLPSGQNRISKPALIAAAAAIAVAAIVYGVTQTADTNKLEPTATTPEPQPPYIAGSRFELLVGEVSHQSAAARADGRVIDGAPVATTDGRAVITLPGAVTVSIGNNTAIEVRRAKTAGLEVAFESGTALFALDPKRAPERFTVVTRDGTIEVTGTVFTLAVSEAATAVHLHRGELVVTDKRGRRRQIQSGHSAVLGSSDTAPISEQVAAQMRVRALEILDLKLAGHLSSVLDREKKPDSPPLKQVPADFEPGDRQERLRYLMKTARADQLDGNWNGAVATYEEIIALYGKSGDAATARVLLGELYLQKLHRPKKALKHLRAYLRKNPGGSLEPEALLGVANALSALQDRKGEMKTLKQLIEKYPNGIPTEMAQKRVFELSAQ